MGLYIKILEQIKQTQRRATIRYKTPYFLARFALTAVSGLPFRLVFSSLADGAVSLESLGIFCFNLSHRIWNNGYITKQNYERCSSGIMIVPEINRCTRPPTNSEFQNKIRLLRFVHLVIGIFESSFLGIFPHGRVQ